MMKVGQNVNRGTDSRLGKWIDAGPVRSLSGATGDGTAPPERMYKKDIIKVGQYYKASTDQQFAVTPETLTQWVATFNAMSAAGVKVTIPNTHAGDGDPDQNRGYVESLWVEGDSLMMLARLIGQDAIDAAARSDVSIFVPAEFIDGAGNVYQQPIVHVAMVTNPVIPGLGKFEPLAASLDGEIAMEFLQKLAAAAGLSLSADVDQAGLQEMLLSWTERKGKMASTVKCSHCGTECSLEHAEPDGDEEEPDGDEAGAKEKELSASHSTPMQVVRMVASARATEINELVRKGCISAAVAKDLAAEFAEPKSLKLAMDGGDDGGNFERLLATLSKNNARVESTGKGRSGPQTGAVALSDPLKDGDEPGIIKDARKKAAAAAK